MAYWKQYTPWSVLSPAIEKFRTIVQNNSTLITDEPYEIYWMTADLWPEAMRVCSKEMQFLSGQRHVAWYPYETGYAIAFHSTTNGDPPTISPTHIRLPKLSHLITLIPEDFFLLLRIIHTAKRSPAPTLALIPNLPPLGIQSLDDRPILRPFFRLLKVNYRMADECCDKKWTSFADISTLVNLDPTMENQFAAMQYLTSIQNPELAYFPLSAALTLELSDIDEFGSSGYCAPARAAGPRQ